MPSTSQRRAAPAPTSTMARRCDVDNGSTATLRIGPLAAPPPSGVRFSSHSASGISAITALNHSSGVQLTGVIAGRRSAARQAAQALRWA